MRSVPLLPVEPPSRPRAPLCVITPISSPAHLKSCSSRTPQRLNSSPPFKGGSGQTSAPLLLNEALTLHGFTCFYLARFRFSQTFYHVQVNWPQPGSPGSISSVLSSQRAPTTVAPSIREASLGGTRGGVGGGGLHSSVTFLNFVLSGRYLQVRETRRNKASGRKEGGKQRRSKLLKPKQYTERH